MVVQWGMKLMHHSCETSPVGGGRYRPVTVHTHGDFIVLPHWNTRPVAPWSAIPLSCIILILSQSNRICPILIMLSARLGSDKYQFEGHWFDSTRVRKLWGLDSNPRPSDSPIFQNGRQALLLIQLSNSVNTLVFYISSSYSRSAISWTGLLTNPVDKVRGNSIMDIAAWIGNLTL